MADTKVYRLRKGAKHVHNGKVLAAGDTAELTDVQYKAFKDKFIDDENPVERAAAPKRQVAAGTPGLPQDLSAKNPELPTDNPDNKLPGPIATAKL